MAQTFTDTMVTYTVKPNEGSRIMEAARVCKIVNLQRVNHPPKFLSSFKSSGPALRIPVTTASVKASNAALPFYDIPGIHV